MRLASSLRTSVLAAAAVLALAAGCSNPDTIAPPSPFLEATPKLTSLPTVVLAGVAEYGSMLTVDRDPVFGAGETAPTAIADLITGRFRFDAPLAAGVKNVFSLKATDAAGNASPAAVVEVLHEIPRPRFVRLTPTATVIDTDGGQLTALVEVRHGEPGVSVEGMQVVLAVTGYVHAIAPVTAAVNAAGFAEVAIDGFDKVGTGTLVATAVLKAPDGSAAGDARGFAVLAGRPSSAILLLAATADTAAPSEALTVTAGTDVTASVSVSDAHGNTLIAPPLTLVIDAPRALISGSTLANLIEAGSFHVFASVSQSQVTTSAALVVEPGPAAQVTLALSSADLVAGQTLTATGRSLDSFGNVRPEAVVLAENAPAWSYGGASDPQDFTGVATTAGDTSATLVPRTTGTYEATATLGLFVAHAAFAVRPAALATFDFNITAGTYKAADVVPFTYAVRDSFGNDTRTPLVVTVNAPAAVVFVDGAGQGELSGIVRAGAYTVVARAVGSAFSKSVALNIQVAPSYGFNLVLSASLISEGSRVLLSLFDGYGNSLDLGLVDLFIDNMLVADVPTVALSGRELTFNVAGTYHVKAQLKADTNISDIEILSVQGIVDTLPPTAVIQSIAFPAGTDVATRGFISAVVAFADNKSLAEGELIGQFGDSPSCTATTGRLILSGLTAASPQVTLRAPSCALPLDKITLVARVLDQAGNVAFSPTNTTLRMAPLPGFDFAASGYAAVTIGYGNRLNNGTLADLAVDPTSETVFVTQQGKQRVVVLFPDRSQSDLKDANGQPYLFNNPIGIATSRQGNLWVGDANGNPSSIDIIPASLGPAIQPAVALSQSPGRLGLDEQGSVPMVCAALTSAGNIRCWKTDPIANPAQLFSTNVGGAPVSVAIRAGAQPRLFWVDQSCAIKSFPLVYGAGTVAVGSPTTTFLAAGQDTCSDLAVLPSGDVAIVDTTRQQILRAFQNGGVGDITVWNGSTNPVGIDFANGRLFVVDDALRGVFAITATGTAF